MQGLDLEVVAYTLSNIVPKVISLQLNAYGSRHHLTATMHELVESLQGARPLPISISKEQWLQQRKQADFEKLTARGGGGGSGGLHSRHAKPKHARIPLTVPPLPSGFSSSLSKGSTRSMLLDRLKTELTPYACRASNLHRPNPDYSCSEEEDTRSHRVCLLSDGTL